MNDSSQVRHLAGVALVGLIHGRRDLLDSLLSHYTDGHLLDEALLANVNAQLN